MKTGSKEKRRGFTLIEILVVIAIMATLAAASWAAKALIESRAMKKTAETQISQLETALNEYRADNGDLLPYGRGDIASSNILYKALSCDEDNDGEPDKKDENGNTRTPYCTYLAPITNNKATDIEQGIPCRKARIKGKKVFVILDPWENPYRYRLGYEMLDEKGKSGKGMNPDFDIFSQGPDGAGNGLTPNGDNEDNISNVRSWK